ncbi:MAG: iron transporter [Pyrinomonadaceae bacterium]
MRRRGQSLCSESEIHLTINDADGKEIGTHEMPFLWHPYLYHYGRNWKVPGDGEYSLHFRIETPDFPRRDKKRQAFYRTCRSGIYGREA